MPDEVQALSGREELQRDRDEFDDLVEAARSRGAQKRFQLRKREFDRIEIRAVGRQKPKARADTFNRRLYLRLFVHRQVVEDDDIARPQGRDEHLLDVREKRGIVDWTIEDGRCENAIDAQSRHDRVGLPVSVGRVVAQSQTARAAAVAPEQIGGDAGLVNEDVATRVVQRQRVLPSPPGGRDISASLFVGEYRFF